MRLPSCTGKQNRNSWWGVVVVHHIFDPNQRHFEFISSYDIMRACPVLPCGCITTSFVKFSWICMGSFDFVGAGKFRVFTVLNTMMISKFLEPIYQSLSKVCVAVGAHTKPVFQATSHPMIPSSICRIASKTNISGSCRTNRRGSKTTVFISCILAHCGHKYGPNELSHCTHRPMSQLTHCGHKYKPNEMSEVVLIYSIKLERSLGPG